MVAIHLHMLRGGSQRSYRPLHRKQTGLKYIDTINLLYLRTPQRPGQRLLPDYFRQNPAAFFGKFFGISQTLNGAPRCKYDRASNNGTCQRSAPHLIDTGYKKKRGIFITLKIHEMKDIPKQASIKPPCSGETFFPVFIAQPGDGNPLAGTGRMDKLFFADIDSNMRNTPPAQPEKEQIACLKLAQGDGEGIPSLGRDGTRDIDPYLSVGIVNQAAAIHTAERGTAEAIRYANQGARNIDYGRMRPDGTASRQHYRCSLRC